MLRGNWKWHEGVLCLLSLQSLENIYLFTRQTIYKCQILQILAGTRPGNSSTADFTMGWFCLRLSILQEHPLLIST